VRERERESEQSIMARGMAEALSSEGEEQLKMF